MSHNFGCLRNLHVGLNISKQTIGKLVAICAHVKGTRDEERQGPRNWLAVFSWTTLSLFAGEQLTHMHTDNRDTGAKYLRNHRRVE